MAACVLATGWFPLLSIQSLTSKNYNEGWNVYRQWMTLEGEPIYPAPGGLWTTNYGFLSFHIIGLLGAALGNILLAGRLVSLCSLLAVCWLVAAIARGAGGSRAAALYTGLALFAALCSFDSEGRGVDDPEFLSAVFAVFGVFAYMRVPRNLPWRGISAAAFSLSLFTKHDYVAFPLSAGLHLIWTRDWRAVVAFLAVGIGVSASLIALSFWTGGPFALADLLQPRAYLPSAPLFATLHYLLHLLAPLIVGVLVVWRAPGVSQRRFLAALLLSSNVLAIVLSGGDGVANNIFYAPIIADILVLGIALSLLQWQDGRLFRLALTVATVGLVVTVPSRCYFDAEAQSHLPAHTEAARQAIALIETARGPVICEDLLICYEAGKPIGYDPYYVKDQILVGHLQEAEIIALFEAHRFSVVQVRGGVDGKWLTRLHLRFAEGVRRALPADYRPAFVNRFYVVLVPAD